jgi:hypothetical protein
MVSYWRLLRKMKWHNNNKKINKAKNFTISAGIIASIIIDFTT